MSATVITRHSTMGEVLEAYPSAQRAVLRHELAPDTLGGAAIRPLRSTVSETAGCQNSEEPR